MPLLPRSKEACRDFASGIRLASHLGNMGQGEVSLSVLLPPYHLCSHPWRQPKHCGRRLPGAAKCLESDLEEDMDLAVLRRSPYAQSVNPRSPPVPQKSGRSPGVSQQERRLSAPGLTCVSFTHRCEAPPTLIYTSWPALRLPQKCCACVPGRLTALGRRGKGASRRARAHSLSGTKAEETGSFRASRAYLLVWKVCGVVPAV